VLDGAAVFGILVPMKNGSRTQPSKRGIQMVSVDNPTGYFKDESKLGRNMQRINGILCVENAEKGVYSDRCKRNSYEKDHFAV
jgi:hypothetical protein